jgi:hypothetical protein
MKPNGGAAPFVDNVGRLGDTGIAVDPCGSPRERQAKRLGMTSQNR